MLDQCFIKRNELVTREIMGETIIVPVSTRTGDLDSIYTLNDLGTIIWGLIDGNTTVGQIVDAVCQTYEVTREEATKDTLDFFRTLEMAGLILLLKPAAPQCLAKRCDL